MQQGDLTRQEELEILAHFSKITSITNLEQALETVVAETPRLMRCSGCSIYLKPDYVPRYDEKLLIKKPHARQEPHLVFNPDDFEEIDAADIPGEFVVLAANSRPNTSRLVGKAFHVSGAGMTGWVFQHGQALRLSDMSDDGERARYPGLNWSDHYGGSVDYYHQEERKPILAMPLKTDSQIIGVFKFLGPCDKPDFSETDEKIATIVTQVIAGVIRQNWTVREQENAILRLAEMGAKQEPDEVMQAVTERLTRMLGCGKCSLYWRDENGEKVILHTENGRRLSSAIPEAYQRGQDLIGWVFKTSKPLIIENVHEYAAGIELDEDRLESISDGDLINEQDRYLRCEHACQAGLSHPLPFLAVPVITDDGVVRGVLAANCLRGRGNGRAKPFTRADLQLAQFFARTIALSVQNDHDRKLSDLLIEMGYLSEPAALYDLVIRRVPELIAGVDCSIFELGRGAEGYCLRLVQTSQPGARDASGKLRELTYLLGEGKAGFCALAETALVLNYIGRGRLARRSLEDKRHLIANSYSSDLVYDYCDEDGQVVGFAQMLYGKVKPLSIQEKFAQLVREWRITPGKGLVSSKATSLNEEMTVTSWSLLSLPVMQKEAGVFAVINVWRPVDRTPFSPKDVTLISAVSARLAAVLSNLKMQEQRKHLLMTVAHEINTPLTGMLADSENLMEESPAGSDLHKLSRHNLEQVQRLHMQSETIMLVLSERAAQRQFSMHSIYRPLREARELFKSEAEFKGCRILRPRPIGGPFPDIEMLLLDLGIAIKNIIHNAVKYSFRPPPEQPTSRSVSIVGRWADQAHTQYTVAVQNYGVGISEEEITRRLIFEPYYRGEKAADRRRTGAGFGLAHARQVIEDLHHGQITVDSKHVGGSAYLTTFYITLPLRQPGVLGD